MMDKIIVQKKRVAFQGSSYLCHLINFNKCLQSFTFCCLDSLPVGRMIIVIWIFEQNHWN